MAKREQKAKAPVKPKEKSKTSKKASPKKPASKPAAKKTATRKPAPRRVTAEYVPAPDPTSVVEVYTLVYRAGVTFSYRKSILRLQRGETVRLNRNDLRNIGAGTLAALVKGDLSQEEVDTLVKDGRGAFPEKPEGQVEEISFKTGLPEPGKPSQAPPDVPPLPPFIGMTAEDLLDYAKNETWLQDVPLNPKMRKMDIVKAIKAKHQTYLPAEPPSDGFEDV